MKLTTVQNAYLNRHMKKVSRSFALVVSTLEEPLEQYMATAYLICRVVDNIEDCTQPFSWQEKRFEEFSVMLQEPNMAPDVLGVWNREYWPGLTADERRLMGPEDGLALWQIYNLIPKDARTSINKWVSVMAGGMSLIEDPHRTPRRVTHNGVQLLAYADDYDHYCFFVAGTVGRMATELAIKHYHIDPVTAESLLASCEACGRALQKTNIVKDFAKDLRRGISYLPDEWLQEVEYSPLSLAGAALYWRQKVITNVLTELREASQYVLALPQRANGYRMASLMCLLPAYETLLVAARKHENLFTADHKFKMSRMTMARCLRDSRAMVTNNAAIRDYSNRLHQAVGEALEIPERLLRTPALELI